MPSQRFISRRGRRQGGPRWVVLKSCLFTESKLALRRMDEKLYYFTRVDESTFRPSQHVSGAWNPTEQHIGPAMGLLAHVVELDRDARRSDGLVMARLSYDIFGTVPLDVVESEVQVLRPGRTIELVEARLRHSNRNVVSLWAWLRQRGKTTELAGTMLPCIPPPDQMKPWDPSTVWPGGFLASLEVRRAQVQPGRAAYWIRTTHELVDGEQVSPTARAAGLLDLANGMTVRVNPRKVAFPNVDLTAHLWEMPQRDWLGFETSVSFGADGVGVTSSTIHGARGPIGTVSQVLTVRPAETSVIRTEVGPR